MVNALLVILILGFLVIIHEFGHFLAAKKFGIWVEEFGIGIPPKVWGKKIGETLYSLNALPIGGFVKIYGENEAEFELLDKDQPIDKNRAFVVFVCQRFSSSYNQRKSKSCFKYSSGNC